MAISVLASAAAASGDSTNVTTSAIDTTGASLVVVSMTSYRANAAPTMSDNKANSWTILTAYEQSSGARVALAYCNNGTFGSGHTFTLSGASSYPAISVIAYSGTDTADSYDSVVGDNNLSPGTITPANDNSVCVTGMCPSYNPSGVPGLTSGSVVAYQDQSSSFATAIGNLIQESKAAYDPTWSWSGGTNSATTTAVFNAGDGSSPSSSPSESPSTSPSPSATPSNSPSSSPSASPSPGYENYTRGDYAALPGDDADLETPYIPQDYTDVSTDNGVRVAQTATDEYAIHEFKNYVGSETGCTVLWNGQTNNPPAINTVYLQIYNQDTDEWETIDTDNTTAASTDFNLTADIADLTDYKNGSLVISCRVYQLDT